MKLKNALIFSLTGIIGTICVTMPIAFCLKNINNNYQKNEINAFKTNKELNKGLISFSQDNIIDTSINVFLVWCQDWLNNSHDLIDIKSWLIDIGFDIDPTVIKVSLSRMPTVTLNETRQQVLNISIPFIAYVNNNSSTEVTIDLTNKNFKPNIKTPNAVNLYLDDFVNTLEDENTNVNQFLNNYGFQLNQGIVDVEYSNRNFDPQNPDKFYNPDTGNVTIQFLQYADKNQNIEIYQDITFNIKDVYFKLPLKQKPSVIAGIVIGIGLFACVVAYISIRIKRYLIRKNQQPKIIPGWEILKDKQNKMNYQSNNKEIDSFIIGDPIEENTSLENENNEIANQDDNSSISKK